MTPAGSSKSRQTIRLQQYYLAALAYLLALVPLAAAARFGFIRPAPAAGIALAMFAWNAAVYAAFRSEFNLRFRDPSLTKAQVVAGVTMLMATLYHFDVARGISVGLCFLVFLFGVFRLTTREFIHLSLYTLAAYALVINLLMHLRPQAIDDVYVEWFNWLLLAMTLPVFALVAGRISSLRERLKARNDELQQAIGQIHAMATRDEVTGLHNRPFFVESLRHALAQATRHRRSLALFFIDADRFKLVNDTLGHDAGDQVLRELALRISGCVRESDIVARLGGDEFVVLVENAVPGETQEEIALKILRSAARPLRVSGREIALSVSIGVTVAPGDGVDEHQLMRNADVAMYRAKAQGRNSYSLYARQMSADADERLALEAELGRAVERDELRLYFQPKVYVSDGALSGVEALLRWQHPRHGLIAPDRFIRIAEETGAIVPIGRWVLRTACWRAAEWAREYGRPLAIAVNLSARQFTDPGLLQDIRSALAGAGLDANLLELEITESAVMQDPEHAVGIMRTLREEGVRISMDDFGTGYSSLGYLKRFPVTTVKIDRSFVDGLPNGGDDAAIARSVLAMAQALGLKVVAEGVERAEQLEFLRGERCGEYQGFLFSAPLPASEMAKLLGSSSTLESPR